jgi:putative hydrolase
MQPVEALTKAIYYLDRELAPSSKVRAFVRAIEIVEAMSEEELAERVNTRTLTELDGIGPSISQAITEAHRGVTGGYLDKLERRSRIPLGAGEAVRAALKGDCHLHSTWSDGGAPVRAMADTAMALGHEYIVLTDHSARLTIAHGLNEQRLREQLAEVRALNEDLAPFRILTGMEVDILEDGSLDLSDEMLAELDVVVASVHSKMRMPREEMTRRMVLAVANPHVDVLGHCTNRKVVGSGRAPSQFDAEIVFAACARFGTAVEINCRPERQDPPEELLQLALDWECDIAISTDAHAPGQMEWQAYGCDKAVRCGVPLESIVNTWAADDLVAWAASHATA